MRRIEAHDSTGRVMAYWNMDELYQAKRMVSLSDAPWTLGVSDFESEAEADAQRLDWLESTRALPNIVEWPTSLDDLAVSVREAIDAARNAPAPTFERIEL